MIPDEEIRVPELDAVFGSYNPHGCVFASDYTPLDEARLKLYYGKVPPELLVKHIAGGKKTYRQIARHVRVVKAKEKRDRERTDARKSAPTQMPGEKVSHEFYACFGKFIQSNPPGCQQCLVSSDCKLATSSLQPPAENAVDPSKIGLKKRGRPRATTKEQLHPTTCEESPFKPRVKVRQVKPDGGRLMQGIGEIVDRHGEICTIRNGGATYKILAACLEIAGDAP